MLTDLSETKVLVVDNGLFPEFAARLARDFRDVDYFCNWKDAFPRRERAAVGEGIPGVTKVWNLWDAVDTSDLVAFPDVLHADLQDYLRGQGKRVWGAGGSEWLELDRLALLDFLGQSGLPVPEHQVVRGTKALRELLAGRGDCYVKLSVWRGNLETFNHIADVVTEPLLASLEHDWGPLADSVDFLVEEPVDGIEIAIDTITVDGLYPELGCLGLEVKGSCYVGSVLPWGHMPKPLRTVYDAFAPVLRQNKARTTLALETRIGADGTPYVVDPCLRLGSPSSEAYLELITNLSEVIWEGASGRLLPPEPSHRWCVTVVLGSDWALKHWTPIRIPPEVRRWVKIKNLYQNGKDAYFAPMGWDMNSVGCAVGLGDTLDEAIEMATDVAARVQGYQLKADTHAFDEAKKQLEKAAQVGIDFGL